MPRPAKPARQKVAPRGPGPTRLRARRRAVFDPPGSLPRRLRRPRHAVRLLHRAAFSRSVPDPRRSLGSIPQSRVGSIPLSLAPRPAYKPAMQIEPFRIAVPDDALLDLQERLSRTRLPHEATDSGWTYGTNLAYLRELVTYWRERYDW